MKELEADEDYRDATVESLREALRAARTRLAPEDREEVVGRLVAAGKRVKQMASDLETREDEVSALEDRLEEAEPAAKELLAIVGMVYDMERRLITPRELVQMVRDNYHEDGTKE